MPYLETLPANSGPPAIYTKYPPIYRPWADMSEALMNGPSPLTRAERELIFAYAAGLIGCEFVYVAHAEVAYALGIERGTFERLLDQGSSAADGRLQSLLIFVRKLSLEPGDIIQADVDLVFASGWNEEAFDHAIAIVGRAMFMRCLALGYGFTPMNREEAGKRALKRIEHGYVNVYPAFRNTSPA